MRLGSESPPTPFIGLGASTPPTRSLTTAGAHGIGASAYPCAREFRYQSGDQPAMRAVAVMCIHGLRPPSAFVTLDTARRAASLYVRVDIQAFT